MVDRIALDTLRGRFLPHLIDCCRGIEVAVGRRLPALRETVAAKLTRDAAMNALKVAGASAVVDHVPILGIVLGAFASGADMFAITGIQMNLMLNIGATYGRDPDLSAMWELLPVVGGGFGWRALAREISGFIPVGGMFIKAAIAYAGTVVVGEGVAYYYRTNGRQMGVEDAAHVYDDAKASAMTFARDVLARFRRNGDGGNGSLVSSGEELQQRLVVEVRVRRAQRRADPLGDARREPFARRCGRAPRAARENGRPGAGRRRESPMSVRAGRARYASRSGTASARSRTTSVPAAKSPSRLFSFEISALIAETA